MRPLSEANLSRVKAVFTDVDGTLTTEGRLRSQTLAAIEKLHAAEVPVVFVTGRPAGWAEAWARTLPLAGVIAENGGISFIRSRKSVALRKVYWESEAVRRPNRKRLIQEVLGTLERVPGARLSMDSSYTEVDLAIDYNEDARLGLDGAEAIEMHLAARGVTAVRSSVHVNAWIAPFDKAKAVKRFLKTAWGVSGELDRYVYVGDSLNDAPLFEAFALSVGVANVKDVLGQLACAPAFVTRGREGRGFEEVARAVLRARPGRKVPHP